MSLYNIGVEFRTHIYLDYENYEFRTHIYCQVISF